MNEVFVLYFFAAFDVADTETVFADTAEDKSPSTIVVPTFLYAATRN